MKKWEVQKELRIKKQELRIDEIVNLLLENRGIKTKKEREEFLNPHLESVTPKSVGIDAAQLKKALKRIQKAIDKKEQIIVFGDYDVDGITGAAILWEALHGLGAQVMPYIPNRIDEGYGLSEKGISNLLQKFAETCHPELVSGSSKNDKKMLKQVQHDKDCSGIKLIITVDNGIVAHEAVKFANEQGIDVIITDHHVPPAGRDKKLPDAYAIVHTTKLCGAGVAFLLSQELKNKNEKLKTQEEDTHLELATLGTVADMVPLTNGNRVIVKHGLEKLAKTKRVGLRELFKNAGIEKDIFSVYEIGYIIGPRLNAAGRIADAMDSLRLLCTKRQDRAEELAGKLELTNKERQLLLKEAAGHAIAGIRNQESGIRKLLVIGHESYAEGVIGLVAGKLVEEFYRPAIVIAKRDGYSKASARSVSGFNIIEFLRSHQEFFVNVGGHPMAAGFTIETEKIALFQKTLTDKADGLLDEVMLTKKLKIDCELPFFAISTALHSAILQLGPFGVGNPEPVFATRGVMIQEIRILGKDGKHLRLRLAESRIKNQESREFEAIAFGMGEMAGDLHSGDTIDVAYTLDENTWNGRTKLQLKVKDVKKN